MTIIYGNGNPSDFEKFYVFVCLSSVEYREWRPFIIDVADDGLPLQVYRREIDESNSFSPVFPGREGNRVKTLTRIRKGSKLSRDVETGDGLKAQEFHRRYASQANSLIQTLTLTVLFDTKRNTFADSASLKFESSDSFKRDYNLKSFQVTIKNPHSIQFSPFLRMTLKFENSPSLIQFFWDAGIPFSINFDHPTPPYRSGQKRIPYRIDVSIFERTRLSSSTSQL
jgi:hypothetical protein